MGKAQTMQMIGLGRRLGTILCMGALLWVPTACSLAVLSNSTRDARGVFFPRSAVESDVARLSRLTIDESVKRFYQVDIKPVAPVMGWETLHLTNSPPFETHLDIWVKPGKWVVEAKCFPGFGFFGRWSIADDQVLIETGSECEFHSVWEFKEGVQYFLGAELLPVGEESGVRYSTVRLVVHDERLHPRSEQRAATGVR